MNYVIVFFMVAAAQVVMSLINPDSSVSRADVISGAFIALFSLWILSSFGYKP